MTEDFTEWMNVLSSVMKENDVFLRYENLYCLFILGGGSWAIRCIWIMAVSFYSMMKADDLMN